MPNIHKMKTKQDQAQQIQEIQALQNRVHSLSAIVGRARLAAKLGAQYGGDRDIYQALGYKREVSFEDFYIRYKRQDIAKAIIDRPITATWRGALELLEADDDEDTEFEKKWRQLNKKLGLKSRFARVDRLAGLGKYGILLFGLDDVHTKEDFQRPVQGGQGRKLLYVKPLSEYSAQIESWEAQTDSERYGLPTIYRVEVQNPGDRISSTIYVHHSRIVHVSGELLEGEVEGTPRLEIVFNRLYDLEKIVGGSAEMFWRGARPGYQGKVDDEYQMPQDEIDKLQEQIDEYEHNLRRLLINRGLSLESLDQQVVDPEKHVDIQIQMISAVTGIPKRILTGSERGELASSEDRNNWLDLIQERRDEFAEPCIIRPFVDRCIEYKILPTPTQLGGEYSINWPDLWTQSDRDKAEVGKVRADALRAYGSSPINLDIVPPEVFYQFFLGFETDDIQLINEMRDQAIAEEEKDMEGIEEEEI